MNSIATKMICEGSSSDPLHPFFIADISSSGASSVAVYEIIRTKRYQPSHLHDLVTTIVLNKELMVGQLYRGH